MQLLIDKDETTTGEDLSQVQKKVMLCIQRVYTATGAYPPQRMLCDLLGRKSIASAQQAQAILERKGYLSPYQHLELNGEKHRLGRKILKWLLTEGKESCRFDLSSDADNPKLDLIQAVNHQGVPDPD